MNDTTNNYQVCLGRGNTQIPFIRKAKLLGYKIICFDKNNNSIGKKIVDQFYNISVLNFKSIVKIIKKKNNNIIGSASYNLSKNNIKKNKKIYAEKVFKNFPKKNKNRNFLKFNCYSSKNSRLLTRSVLGQSKNLSYKKY